ncbi:uncharacterized protein DUF4405 [Desulfobotulus alkaliphilus]|uniref:Uncharacterized protein DUF4405 n=1 Tax=Desulfobotulus alkaliphilus TaxID=622671 RepID=A0A562S6D0_9BACT|nr:DUF4405 domain-containing protein [Desulfobotulus alkaliphilus]TWI76738.1 uncharacterized protein DUF4405 [Desulfobotulus alkaliphilus]
MKQFSIKKWTSLTLCFTFAIAAFSGIILAIMPHGRQIHWMGWQLMGVEREGWQALHVAFSLLILLAGVLHLLAYNWKLFVSYFKNREKKWGLSREFYGASLVTLIFLVSSVTFTPPVSWLMNGVDHVKEAWVTEDNKPPFPRADSMSLADVCRMEGLSLEQAVEKIRAKGLEFRRPEQTLGSIARANGLSARDVYLVIRQD